MTLLFPVSTANRVHERAYRPHPKFRLDIQRWFIAQSFTTASPTYSGVGGLKMEISFSGPLSLRHAQMSS